jgi:hypothetical protein
MYELMIVQAISCYLFVLTFLRVLALSLRMDIVSMYIIAITIVPVLVQLNDNQRYFAFVMDIVDDVLMICVVYVVLSVLAVRVVVVVVVASVVLIQSLAVFHRRRCTTISLRTLYTIAANVIAFLLIFSSFILSLKIIDKHIFGLSL